MTVMLFATLKDHAGASHITVDTPDRLTVGDLRDAIARQYPRLAELTGRSIVSVNQEFAFNHDTVLATDEVAVFPPVSGGLCR